MSDSDSDADSGKPSSSSTTSSAASSPAAVDSNAISNDAVSPLTSKPEELGKASDDAGSGKEDMFEDCPDDILAADEVERLKIQLDITVAEKESFARKIEDERAVFGREVGVLRIQLKGLSDDDEPQNGSGENGEEGVRWNEVIKECSVIVNKALEKQTQIEERVRELEGVVYMKDQEIEGLNANVKYLSDSHLEKDAYFEALADRMLASLGGVVGQHELADGSIAGKLVHVENGNYMLVENFNRMLYEMEQFRQCLPETVLEHSSQEFGGIFAAARNELIELRRKEAEFVERFSHLEDGNRKLVEELDNQRALAERVNAEIAQTRLELEHEKNRCANTREKLTMAVQKGKGLVQQRDSLKHTIAEKVSELEKCRIELQEKTSDLEAAELSKEDLIRSENSVASLQETLSQNNLILQKLEEILSQTGLPEDVQSMQILAKLQRVVDENVKLKEISTEFQTLKDAMYASGLPDYILSSSLGSQINWLRESYSQANEEVLMLRDQITATKEVAHKNIDQLTESLSAELHAKENLQAELDNIKSEYNEIIKKEHQVSLEKSQMVSRLLDVSGVVMYGEDGTEHFSDIAKLMDTCVRKIQEQSSASLSGEIQAKEVLQGELDRLTSEYKEVVQKERQVSSENAEMVKILSDVSGIEKDIWSLSQISSDMSMFINTCIEKIKEKSTASIEELNASLSAEMQAKEYVQEKLDSLTSNYKEIVERERQVSSEKNDIVKMLLDVSGLEIDNEDVTQLSSDMFQLINRCTKKIKEQSSASLSADMQAKEVLQAELDSLASKYNEIAEQERRVASENSEMVKMLVGASGIVMENEDASQLSSDIGTFINTCIGKIQGQSNASLKQLTASLSGEMRAKEALQAELDRLTSEYKEVFEKKRQVSSEKAEMVKMLLDVSGIGNDDEDITQLSSDHVTLIDRSTQKIKERSTASLSADVQAKDVLQAELESLTLKYNEVVEKERQAASVNAEMVKILVDISGIVMDEEDVSQLSSDIDTFINTCIGKIKEQSSASLEQLTDLLSGETQAKEALQAELDRLSSKYKEIVEKERQMSSEKAEMVKMLLDVSGIEKDDEDITQLSSDIVTLIDRCTRKIKEQSSASLSSPVIDVEQFETIQSQLYIRDQELVLCRNILEEDMLVKSEVNKLSEELQVASQQVQALKEENGSQQREIERLEEKNAMIREKLSMAVKKGKGMYQERENLKLRMEEKNTEIEKLRLELQQEQSTLSECRDKINSLSADTEYIPKLEADLVSVKEQRDQFEQFLLESNKMLQTVTKAIDSLDLPVDSVVEEPLQKVNWLAGYLRECQDAETKAKQELRKVEEEISNLVVKLEEAHSTIKSLEGELSMAEDNLSQLAEQTKEMEADKINLEKELQRATEEAASQHNKISEVLAAKESLEEALSLVQNNLSTLVSEKEGVLLSRAAADVELGTLKEEVDIHTSKLTEAYETINSLEVALSQAQANVSLLTEQNNDVQIGRSNLEAELKKLQEEARLQNNKLADASATITSLEDALLKARDDISELETGKKNAEEEILTLNSKLNESIEELSGTNGSAASRSLELTGHLDNLQVLMRDKSMLLMMKRCFEKKFDRLKEMDLILKKIRDYTVSGGLQLQSNQLLEEDSYATDFSDGVADIFSVEKDSAEVNGDDGDDTLSYLKMTVERLQQRNMILSQKFERFSSFTDEFIETLFRNLQARSNGVAAMFEHMESFKQKTHNLEIRAQEQENTIAILENDLRSVVSACTDATRELQFDVKNKLLELRTVPELEGLRHTLPQETGAIGGDTMETLQQGTGGSSHDKTTGMLSVTCRNIQNLMRQFVITSEVAASTIEELQNKLKEVRTTSEKAIEERNIKQNRISQLEVDIEVLESSCADMTLKLEDYQGTEDRLKEREAELSSLHSQLSVKEQENEGSLLSASEVQILLDKIEQIDILMPESEVGDLGTKNSVHVKKLFYFINNISQFQHQISSLSRDKEELESTVRTQLLEIKHLKEELESYVRYEQDSEKMKDELSLLILSLEKVIGTSGGNDLVGDEKPAGVKGLLSVLEKQVMALLLDSKHSKSKAEELGTKLVERQKFVDELSRKMNLLEVSAQGRVAQPESVQERSIFEAPSLPNGSEISEIDDVGSRGSNTISPVPSAAHVRMMRKGSTEQLAIDIDPESTRLISAQDTDEDKGHVFKSLNASGIIPKQGKLIADRVDGIWVSGGRSLMSRPRARLGIIAYCLFLHLWLLGVIIL